MHTFLISHRDQSVHGSGLGQAAQLLPYFTFVVLRALFLMGFPRGCPSGCILSWIWQISIAKEQPADLNLLPVSVWKSTSLLISFPVCISHLNLETKLTQKTLQFLLLQITSFKKKQGLRQWPLNWPGSVVTMNYFLH